MYTCVYIISLAAIFETNISTAFLSALQIFEDNYHLPPYSRPLSLKISCSFNDSNHQ